MIHAGLEDYDGVSVRPCVESSRMSTKHCVRDLCIWRPISKPAKTSVSSPQWNCEIRPAWQHSLNTADYQVETNLSPASITFAMRSAADGLVHRHDPSVSAGLTAKVRLRGNGPSTGQPETLLRSACHATLNMKLARRWIEARMLGAASLRRVVVGRRCRVAHV